MPRPVRRFSTEVIEALSKGKMLRIRAGAAAHRDIGIWVVVVAGRVFVRSWSLAPRSWYRTFLEEPHGTIRIGERELEVRAIRTRSERLKDAVDEAYAAKYTSAPSLKYVKGFRAKKRRDTTTELVPE